MAYILCNHSFLPSCSDPAFQFWSNRVLHTIDDLYSYGVFYSFSDLSGKFNFPNNHLFRYFQIRQYVQSQFPQFPNRPPYSMIGKFLSQNTSQQGLLSTLYNLISNIESNFLDALRATWSQDLRVTLTEEKWAQILEGVHSSLCARHSLIQ